jgi:dATP/dGTP diphosphohydrolase
MLTSDSKSRKGIPMARGLLDYFPDALAAVARLSVLGNEKHNPGEPLHWSREKSSDHADCVIRHLVDRGKWDTESYSEPVRHSTEAAWRALANLQIEIEEDEQRSKTVSSRERFHDSAESEYLAEHGISVGLARTELDHGGTHSDPWPYEAKSMVDRSEATIDRINQKVWKPGRGG